MHVSTTTHIPPSLVTTSFIQPPPPLAAKFGLETSLHIQLSQVIQPQHTPKTMESALPVLTKLMRGLRYGQEHLRLNPDACLVIDERKKEIRIPQYNPEHHLNPEGLCHHLTDALYTLCSSGLPGFTIAKAIGLDPQYYSRAQDTHCFLLIDDNDFIQGQRVMQSAGSLASAIKHNPWVVDPSFKVIRKLSESGYTLKAVIGTAAHQKLHPLRMAIIKHGDFLPLGLTKGFLYGIGVDWEVPDKIIIAIRHQNAPRELFDLAEDLSYFPPHIQLWQQWLTHVRRKIIA